MARGIDPAARGGEGRASRRAAALKVSRVALAQMTSTADVAANLDCAFALLDEAVAGGARLLAYPEVFACIAGREEKLAAAEGLDGPIVSAFCERAARHGITILLGSLHERIPGNSQRVHNTSVLIGGDGALLASYRKQKLFGVDLPGVRIRESDTIEAGAEAPPVVESEIGRLALTVCFDLRFSEIYRDLRFRGAEIVFVPSNFTAPTGAAHWEILLRARAIESQVFVLAPAQEGRHSPRYRSWGHSMAVDPWGRVLAERATGVGLVWADIDLGVLHDVRAKLPMD